MNQTSIGKRIAMHRKEKNWTQSQLAEKIGISDKAVSKWERDLSTPDIYTLTQLAELFDISLEELTQGTGDGSVQSVPKSHHQLVLLILRCTALGIGVAVLVLNLMGKLTQSDLAGLLSVGFLALTLHVFLQNRH